MTGIQVGDGHVRFSGEEKARRFAAVRARMRQRGVSALIVRSDSAKWDCGSAESRYLTQIGGNGEEGYTVFDLVGDPVFVIWGPGHIENWLAAQDWTTDIRPSSPTAAHVVASRIRELGLEQAAIGLVGRARNPLGPDGRWPHLAFDALRRELPRATFVDFDDDLAAVRTIKSPEEIACHERAMAITEEAIEVMYAHARPGVPGREVFGRMVGALVAAGSDMSVMVQLNIARAPRLAARLVTHRPLEPGDVILNEITGKYGGYWSQAHAPVAVGRAPSAAHQRLFDLVLAGLERGRAALRPGVTVGDLAAVIRQPAEDAGCGWNPIPTVKGIGLATSELPVSPPPGASYGGDAAAVIEASMVVCFQPAALDRDGNLGMHVAETFLVTATGCRRLGRRQLEFRAT
jgi:Xaa-Pro aminopeptidase